MGPCLPDGTRIAGRHVQQDVAHLQLDRAALEHQQPPHLLFHNKEVTNTLPDSVLPLLAEPY